MFSRRKGKHWHCLPKHRRHVNWVQRCIRRSRIVSGNAQNPTETWRRTCYSPSPQNGNSSSRQAGKRIKGNGSPASHNNGHGAHRIGQLNCNTRKATHSRCLASVFGPIDLNCSVTREHYPHPKLEELTLMFSGANYFSVLDVTFGFWQIKLDNKYLS